MYLEFRHWVTQKLLIAKAKESLAPRPPVNSHGGTGKVRSSSSRIQMTVTLSGIKTNIIRYHIGWGFPGGCRSKEPTCHAGDKRDSGSIPGCGRSLRRAWQSPSIVAAFCSMQNLKKKKKEKKDVNNFLQNRKKQPRDLNEMGPEKVLYEQIKARRGFWIEQWSPPTVFKIDNQQGT